MRQFGGTQLVPHLSDLSKITCEYRDRSRDTKMIRHASSLWVTHKSSIDYHTCLGYDYEWSIVEFKEWRANIYPCFIIDLSLSNPLNLRLPVDVLRDYTFEFEVRVESALRSLRECLVEVVRDRDYCKGAFDVVLKDFDKKIGRAHV